MEELLRTNDPVLISYVGSLLDEAGIVHIVADANMSILEGSLGVLPRRVLVEADDLSQARRVLQEADIGHVVTDEAGGGSGRSRPDATKR